MRYLADTNIILRFVNRNDPLHPVMRGAIRTLRLAGHQICLVPQNCIEFWNVSTRPKTRNGYGLSTAAADNALRLLERLFPVLPEFPDLYSEWKTLVVQHSVSGVQVHDARLVAAMRIHHISHILTSNVGDFTRYRDIGIVATHPSQV